MAKIALLFIIVLLSGSLFFSCENLENNDRTNPQIRVFEIKDTLLLTLDTINTFYAELWDDKELSTYKIQIFPAPNMPTDTVRDSVALIKFVRVWTPLPLRKDTAMINGQFSIPSEHLFIRKDTTPEQLVGTFPVLEGDYILRFGCMDLAGNYDSIDTNVKLIYPPKIQQPQPLP